MPYDRTSYFEDRRQRNLAQAGGGGGGYNLASGQTGMYHDITAPEATMRAAETEAISRENIARTQAGASMYGSDASMYGSDNQLEGTLAPKYSLARAAGGPVKGKRPYLVGEKGPELMVPKQSGTIIPNHSLREIARAIPRAGGGDVEAGGAPVAAGRRQGIYDRTAQRLKDFDTRVAQGETDKKSLLQASANIDPTGQRGVNLANAANISAATDKVDMADAQKTYKDAFDNEHAIGYKKDAAGNPTTPILPDDDNLRRVFYQGKAHVQAGTHTPEEATQAIQPDIHKHYATPENVDKVLAASGQPVTPELRASLLSGTPAMNAKLYPKIKAILSQPKPGFWGSAANTNVGP